MNQPTVLIVADDPDFAQAIVGRWQAERSVPGFVLLSSESWTENRSAVDLAIVGAVAAAQRDVILRGFGALQIPVIYVAGEAAPPTRRPSRVLTLSAQDGWLDSLILLAAEVLKRQEALARARRAENVAEQARAHAMLGRYMIEMRHSFNNALTSVLGNSELLLLEPGALSGEVREQVATIHSMALRMNEILQRFSSMEAEMRAAQKIHPESTERNPLYSAAVS